MANNKTPFHSTVAIFVIILYMCQFVVSIPISIKHPRINAQSYTNKVTIIIDNQNYERSSDAYDSIAKFSFDFPDTNVHNSILKFFSDSAEFIKSHIGHIVLIIGILVIVAIIFLIPALLTAFIRLIGFGAKGIVRGSLAALVMASHGGKVAASSACAILQQAGALGVNGFTGLIKLLFNLSSLLVSSIFRLITCS